MAQNSTQSVRDLIERPHHTAVSCRDWDRMRAFFVDLLGFKVVGEMDNRDEPDLSMVTGLPGRQLPLGDAGARGLPHRTIQVAEPEGKPAPIRQCDHGLTHICLQVKDSPGGAPADDRGRP